MRGLAVATAASGLVVAGLVATAAGPAAVAAPSRLTYFTNDVTFIGDSVTAGFGFCGIAENAAHVSCKANQELANSWYSLRDCKPPDTPPLNDACSNDNDNGKPWDAGPWHAGPDAPDVAYPYQIAASQSTSHSANVSDWAITGSTPADWDPNGGVYGPEIGRLHDQYVVMTLGANPILSYFTDIKLFGQGVKGKCVDSTGYREHGTWYAGDSSRPFACIDSNWSSLNQAEHLENIYETLLRQHDRILVLEYYPTCPWSFGNWQPWGNIVAGPASGNSCRSEKRPQSPGDPAKVSQWEQAGWVARHVNNKIVFAAFTAREWAKDEWPGTTIFQNLTWTAVDRAGWDAHQPPASDAWVIRSDTWIHPSKAGAASLAGTVTKAICREWEHWCGSPPAWG